MPEKFIPYNKLSKKQQKKINSSKRNTWGSLNPVTRVDGDNKQRYSRKEKYVQKDYLKNYDNY